MANGVLWRKRERAWTNALGRMVSGDYTDCAVDGDDRWLARIAGITNANGAAMLSLPLPAELSAVR